MKEKTILEKPKRTFWWAIGYINIWLIFFVWIIIWIFWWFYESQADMWIVKLWIWISLAALLIMWILHIVIFRLKWETRNLLTKIIRKIWKFLWIWIWIAIVLLIINIIYGKLQYNKIPQVDESIFVRTDHQTKLPDEQDAIVQLEKLRTQWENNKLRKNLEAIYLSSMHNNHNTHLYKESKVWRQRHQDECIVVYSWDEASCGTWVWSKDTISRFFDRYLNKSERSNKWIDDYLSLDGEKVTIREYIQANEPQIRADLQELDRIASMDYYIPNDRYAFPTVIQWYTRASMTMLLYYTDIQDWEMVKYIIQLNYKNTDILNELWSLVITLVSSVCQDIVDSTVNSAMKLFPQELKLDLADLYSNNMPNKDEIIRKIAKWEYISQNRQIAAYPQSFGELSSWILLRAPLYSYKDTQRLIAYSYSLLYNQQMEDFDNVTENISKILWKSVYNIYGRYVFSDMMPRFVNFDARINWNIYHKQALIENLKSGEYDMWFNEKQWNENTDYYKIYRLPSPEELSDK